MKENKISGFFYRILTDAANEVWDRVSLWKSASDIEFADGSVLEGKPLGHCLLIRNKAYKVGDICYVSNAPTLRLRCTTAGTTAAAEPSGYSSLTAGSVITDGTAQFTADSVVFATAQSTSNNQKPTVGLLNSTTGAVKLEVGSDGRLNFTNSAGAKNPLSYGVHTDTYDLTETSKTLDENHKIRYVTATKVYEKGKTDGITVHDQTYTFPSGDETKQDLTADHKYQKVNTSNVYQKGVADADARSNTACSNYKAGYIQGVANGVSKSGNITRIDYLYHHHSVNSTNNDSADKSACPYADNFQTSSSGGCFMKPYYHVNDTTTYGNGYWTDNISGISSSLIDQTVYKCSCRKANGQIVSQVVTYK